MTYKLNEDHKIEVTYNPEKDNFTVEFFEYLPSCDRWDRLDSEVWHSFADIAEWYGIEESDKIITKAA